MKRLYITLLFSTIILLSSKSYAQSRKEPEIKTPQEIETEKTIASLKKQVAELNKQAVQMKQIRIERNQYANHNTILRSEAKILQQKNAELVDENKKLNKQLNEVAQYPIIIKSIKVGNTYKGGTIETNYGNTLYSSTSMFLRPQIEYIALKPNQTITLYLKLYENGSLRELTSSISGYSTKDDVYVSSEGKAELSGWGNEIKGQWPKGNYRYEIWYNGMCLKTVDFTLN